MIDRAMVLAAGLGKRMRPLTDRTPKPLLEVRGKPLLQYHIEALQRAGWEDIVINTAWLEEQIVERFGSGDWPGMNIKNSAPSLAPLIRSSTGLNSASPLVAAK